MYPQDYEIDSALDTIKHASKDGRDHESIRTHIYFLEDKVRKLEETLNKVIEFLPPEVKLGLELTKGE